MISRTIASQRQHFSSEAANRVEVARSKSLDLPTTPQGSSKTDFSDVLSEAVRSLRSTFAEAKDATNDALLGRGTPHQAMIAMSKADLTFRFITQTRNKVVDAYREMMDLHV